MTSGAATATAAVAAGPPVLTVTGARADIRLDRPAQHNRLENGDIVLLRSHFAQVNEARDIRVLVLTGTGRTFCSGYDLGSLRSGDADRPAGASFEALTDELENLRVPTICALNGPVYGGGTDLALACDFRIATGTCRMFMPAARIGLQYYPGGLRRYASRLGLGAAKKLFLTGVTIEAPEMMQIGYLDEVVPAESLARRVDELADTLAAQAPLAVEGMKKALNEIARAQLDETAARENHLRTRRSADVREGLKAMQEKRKPQFKGH
jgi:enoyl-CoA hydratase